MAIVGRKDDADKPDWSLIPLWTLPWLRRVSFKPVKKVITVTANLSEYQAIWWPEEEEDELGRLLVTERRSGYLANTLVSGLSCMGYKTLEEGLEHLIPVLAHGAKKYGRFNWRHVAPERYLAAAVRHLYAWERGELVDEESGLHPGLHALACVLILLGLESNDEKYRNDKSGDYDLPDVPGSTV